MTRSVFVKMVMTGVAAVLLSYGPSFAGGTGPIRSVIELYTSQGCSSCPAADALFETYVETPGVLALSFSIDYWDKLGWKDTLASPKFSMRQRTYAQTRQDGQVYTPQMIVNGGPHVVGSHRSAIEAALAKTMTTTRVWHEIAAKSQGDAVVVHVIGNGDATAGGVTIWLATFEKRVAVNIDRGENAGRKIVYWNVVRDITSAGVWDGKAANIRLPRTGIVPDKKLETAVLLQTGGGYGPIIGAARVMP